MAFHATPKNGGLPLFTRALILPILVATIFLMQMGLIDADHNWRIVVRKVNSYPPPSPEVAVPIHHFQHPPNAKVVSMEPPPALSPSLLPPPSSPLPPSLLPPPPPLSPLPPLPPPWAGGTHRLPRGIISPAVAP